MTQSEKEFLAKLEPKEFEREVLMMLAYQQSEMGGPRYEYLVEAVALSLLRAKMKLENWRLDNQVPRL